MVFITNYVYSSLFIFLYMSAFYLIALTKKRNDIVDIAWGIGFLGISIITLMNNQTLLTHHYAINTILFIWAARISFYIFLKNKNKKEDPRYAAWRKKWKWIKLRSYFQVFILQGFFLLIIAYPIISSNSTQLPPSTKILIMGLTIALVGILIESVADYQLKNHIANNPGSVCNTGLWHYTRHPNYLGEAIVWWGFWIASYNGSWWLLGIISPLTITYLLRYVSGVPMAEEHMVNLKGFKQYKKTTNALLPTFSKFFSN